MSTSTRKPAPRRQDRGEEILDYLYDGRNAKIRAACRRIIKGASHGLAIYEELITIDAAARLKGVRTLPHADFLNFQGLLWMMQLELASLLDDYIRTRDERRWLYARLLLLSLYESTKTLRSVFSRGYRRDLLVRLGSANERRINTLHGYIHHAFEDLNADYGDIRDHLLGHRDPDASRRWQALSSLNGLEIKDFAWEVLEWCAAIVMLNNDYLAAIDTLNLNARPLPQS